MCYIVSNLMAENSSQFILDLAAKDQPTIDEDCSTDIPLAYYSLSCDSFLLQDPGHPLHLADIFLLENRRNPYAPWKDICIHSFIIIDNHHLPVLCV